MESASQLDSYPWDPGGEPFTQSCRVLAGSFSQHPLKLQQELIHAAYFTRPHERFPAEVVNVVAMLAEPRGDDAAHPGVYHEKRRQPVRCDSHRACCPVDQPWKWMVPNVRQFRISRMGTTNHNQTNGRLLFRAEEPGSGERFQQ
ncbi:hypothetical protein DPMN_178513 [Dreissena polymorpha]|uniref:Uncharacterized protein n=1 Tax=Dreissena polymorpha TaxID=45954 RepID=A0A9D4EC92_DREPO|nr:hypothetical protein DPMN_178513 [Dreissena polymorpha]